MWRHTGLFCSRIKTDWHRVASWELATLPEGLCSNQRLLVDRDWFRERGAQGHLSWKLSHVTTYASRHYVTTETAFCVFFISHFFLGIANALYGNLTLMLSIKILVYIPFLYLVIFLMLIMQYRLQFWQRNTNMCNINIRSSNKCKVGINVNSGAQKRNEKAQQQIQSSAAKFRKLT